MKTTITLLCLSLLGVACSSKKSPSPTEEKKVEAPSIIPPQVSTPPKDNPLPPVEEEEPKNVELTQEQKNKLCGEKLETFVNAEKLDDSEIPLNKISQKYDRKRFLAHSLDVFNFKKQKSHIVECSRHRAQIDLEIDVDDRIDSALIFLKSFSPFSSASAHDPLPTQFNDEGMIETLIDELIVTRKAEQETKFKIPVLLDLHLATGALFEITLTRDQKLSMEKELSISTPLIGFNKGKNSLPEIINEINKNGEKFKTKAKVYALDEESFRFSIETVKKLKNGEQQLIYVYINFKTLE